MRRPTFTPEQVRAIRAERRAPFEQRPPLAALAARWGVSTRVIRRVLAAEPPYDYGTPVPKRLQSPRPRGRGRRPRGSAGDWV